MSADPFTGRPSTEHPSTERPAGAGSDGTPSNPDSRRWSQLIDSLGQAEPVNAPPADACAEALGEMFVFLDQELDDPAAQSRIATHLDICVDCVAAYDAEKLVRAVVARSCRGERASGELRSRILVLITATSASFGLDAVDGAASSGTATTPHD